MDYARYLASVRELDQGFGQIIQPLKTRGMEDNTLVIFLGDNGEAMLRGKGTLLARGTHVPLIIRWPGRTKPESASSALGCGTDLGPTILAACGMRSLKEMTGISFVQQLLGEKTETRQYVYAERGWHWGPITRTDGLDLSRSITSKRYRYIYNALPNRSHTPVDMSNKPAWAAIQKAHNENKLSSLHQRLYFQNPRPIVELYDLANDPMELNNLAGKKR
ncbi:MAG: sulfatase-like hydrolase/transferase [Rubripirellula sp.]|nr:sulfatase-like hydrolase/transferase [Rubripirellula sp.]